ncbi:hypothetical protein [Thiomonas sp. FB-Cd]|nr:hypothetical protein [Thiomonas sp. FB-Cd]
MQLLRGAREMANLGDAPEVVQMVKVELPDIHCSLLTIDSFQTM